MNSDHRQQTQAIAANVLAIGLGQTPAKCVILIQADPAGTLSRVAAALNAIQPDNPLAKDVELLQAEMTKTPEE